MPRKRQSAKIEHKVISRKIWIVYSTNRQYCFAEEIRGGFFGTNHRCGCAGCDPTLALPEPGFTQLPGEAQPPQLFDPKPGD